MRIPANNLGSAQAQQSGRRFRFSALHGLYPQAHGGLSSVEYLVSRRPLPAVYFEYTEIVC